MALKNLSEDAVRRIKGQKGKGMAANIVAVVEDVSAETVRRIWRGETHRGVQVGEAADAGEVAASALRMMQLQREVDEARGKVEGRKEAFGE